MESPEYPYLSPARIRERFAQTGFNIRKRWGQNFLVDPNHIRLIADHILEQEGEAAEIGPGLGALTHAVLRQERTLYAMEIDPFLSTVLREQFGGNPRFHLLEGDALEYLGHKSGRPDSRLLSLPLLYGNLPYYISTDLLVSAMHLPSLRKGVFLTQTEFARRITTELSESSLNVYLGNFGRWKIAHNVPPGAFYPVPAVHSSLLTYHPHPEGVRCDPSLLERMLRISFRSRRKKLLNSWRSGGTGDLELERLREAARRAGADEQRRAEELKPETYYEMVRLYETA